MIEITPHTPPVHSRPFVLKDAIAGAPFGLSTGRPVRIISWNKKIIGGVELVGLIPFSFGNHEEFVITFNHNGIPSGKSSSLIPREILVMLPLCILHDKPVFVGDTILWHGGSAIQECVVTPSHSIPVEKHGEFTWPQRTVEIWQARMKSTDSRIREFYLQQTFSSKKACEDYHEQNKMSNMRLLRAELISSYLE